jgi:ketosteroid isomerase-like protein
MTPQDNKRTMEGICAELAKGNSAPLREAMADDFAWIIIGTTAWSRTYRGRDAVTNELLRPLLAQFKDRYTNTAERILADGDYVVVQCRGRVTTVSGKPYNNTYCWVIRMAGGKMKELMEYCDTALIDDALGQPS